MDYLYEAFLKLHNIKENLEEKEIDLDIDLDLSTLEDEKTEKETEEELDEAVEIHDELNPLLWNDDKTLKPEIKDTIIKIVDYFVENLKKDKIKFTVKDIILVGSNCSYNYNINSDLDVHIVVDSKGLECPDELYTIIYSAYKSIFNNKYDITIKGIPVEIYVEMDETKVSSKGIYSLNDGWVKEPELEEIPEIDEEEVNNEFKKWEDKYFKIIADEEIPDIISAPIEDIMEFLSEEEINENKEKPDYEWLPVSDKDLELLDTQLEEIGFNIASKRRYDEFGIGLETAIHYQIISKEKVETEDDFTILVDKIDTVLDEFEDITGSPCTYNVGYQTDLYVSAGIDCRAIYHEPGNDIVKAKPIKLKFKDGKPASQQDLDILKDISDRVGYDITPFVPVDKKKDESLETNDQTKIAEIENFIEDIYDLRKKSIAEEGEYGIGNLVFKEMRNLGYINNLKALRISLKAKELSLEQLGEDINNKEIKYRGFTIEEDIETTKAPFFRIYKPNGENMFLEYDIHSFEEAKQYIDERESNLKESILQDYAKIHRDLVRQYGEEFYDCVDEYLAIPEIAKTETYDKIIYSKDGWNKFAKWCNDNKSMGIKIADFKEFDDNLEEAKKKKKDRYYQKPRHSGLPISVTRPSFWKSYEEIAKEDPSLTDMPTPSTVASNGDGAGESGGDGGAGS